MRIRNFLPMNRLDMEARGWDELDFLLITGDAYVDHPSFGVAIIARVLEKHDFRVGILAQPDWKDLRDFRAMGKPRLACMITGGNLDSMVNHYTAAKKKRHKDSYSPGGETGLRPDRATIAYSNRVREALPGVPVIIGGIEASLRRFAHYDYWSNDVKRSILLDSQADLLVFGMGEKAIVEVAERLNHGELVDQITDVRGTMVPLTGDVVPQDTLLLPSFDDVTTDKKKYAEAFWVQYNQQDPFRGKPMYQPHGRKSVLQNRPALPLTQAEMDAIYALPFMGTYHPSYEDQGGVPAIEEVEFSLTSVRGCYGACSFCALTFHQGRIIQSRSAESIIREAEQMTWNDRFKGYIHDVGGPTANFRRPACKEQLVRGACSHKQCLFPEPCDKLENDHEEYLNLLRSLRSIPKVKKVFVRSGIRYDAVLADRNSGSMFIRELCEHHVSGQLKVAPEHVSEEVLRLMGKPGKVVYEEFVQKFREANEKLGKEQYLVPYLMSSHPGSTLKEAVELAEYVRDMGVNPEQVQDFIPTPGTLSTCMYYTGLNPHTMEEVYIPRSMHEKAMQRALIQYRSPRNHELVEEALRLAHREDLIGYGPKCLIRPRRYVRADPLEKDGKPSKMNKGKVRRSGMKTKGVESKEERSKDNRSKIAPMKGTSRQETSSKSAYSKEAPLKGAQSKEPRYKGTRSIEAPNKVLQGKESRYKDARTTQAPYKGALAKPGHYKDSRSAEAAPYKGTPGKPGRYKDEQSTEGAPYKGAPGKAGNYRDARSVEKGTRKGAPSIAERFKESRSIETPKGTPAKEGRYKDARGAEKTPYTGAQSEVGRSRAERSLVTPYKAALGKTAPFKDARGKEATPYKGAPGKASGYKGARSVDAPYKGVKSKEVAHTAAQSKEAPSEGIQEKGKARFWRGADNQIHMGKRKHRGGKKDK